jgi:hypothetical protein
MEAKRVRSTERKVRGNLEIQAEPCPDGKGVMLSIRFVSPEGVQWVEWPAMRVIQGAPMVILGVDMGFVTSLEIQGE